VAIIHSPAWATSPAIFQNYYLGWFYAEANLGTLAIETWQKAGVPADALLNCRKQARNSGNLRRLTDLAEYAAALPVENSRTVFDSALDYDNWGLPDSAARLWQHLTETTTSDDPMHWYAAGEQKRLAGLPDEASAIFAQAMARWPDDNRFPDRRIYALTAAGNWQGAAQAAEQWTKRFPLDARAYWWAGESYRILQQPDVATQWFLKAAEVDPKYTQAIRRVGNIFHDSGEYREAIKYYELALAIDPKMSESLYDLGRAYEDLGELGRAIQFVESAIANYAFEGCPYSWYGKLGSLYRREGDLQSARKVYALAVECKPDYQEAIQALKELRLDVR
jgi:tetratricopeptide (TPR) repeat protein